MTNFEELPDLASERLNAAVLAANDEFFAPKEALLKVSPPEWREGAYTERGKWMDGWETGRRRRPGHDWCIIRLGARGVIRGVVVDTSFFTGNYPEHCSIEACYLPGTPSVERLKEPEIPWREILPKSPLRGDFRNVFAIDFPERVNHLRFHIYPDGGVARLRVHGVVAPEWTRFALSGGEVDVAALENGGWVVAVSDRHYGHPQNLILPGRSLFMGDGWETQRRRGPGRDWSIVRLAAPATLHRVEIDTDHYKGNAPEGFVLEGISLEGATADALRDPNAPWVPLIGETDLEPNARHRFEDIAPHGTITHVRLSIYPDGGIARLRLFGTLPEAMR